ncbi:MAG: hypothetical protein J6X02_02950 [Bacilli bacterium]|nr:hypothetical protein [Bacilli bacterium]
MSKKKKVSREEVELMVAAGNDPELHERVKYVENLNDNADSLKKDAIFNGLLSAFWTSFSFYYFFKSQKTSPLFLAYIITIGALDGFTSIRKAIRSREYRVDAQEETEDILAKRH